MTRLFAAAALALACCAPAAAGAPVTRVPILEFHVIGDPPPGAPNPALYDAPETFLEELMHVVRNFPGRDELLLQIGERTLLLGEQFRISAPQACRELAQLPGAGALS